MELAFDSYSEPGEVGDETDIDSGCTDGAGCSAITVYIDTSGD